MMLDNERHQAAQRAAAAERIHTLYDQAAQAIEKHETKIAAELISDILPELNRLYADHGATVSYPAYHRTKSGAILPDRGPLVHPIRDERLLVRQTYTENVGLAFAKDAPIQIKIEGQHENMEHANAFEATNSQLVHFVMSAENMGHAHTRDVTNIMTVIGFTPDGLSMKKLSEHARTSGRHPNFSSEEMDATRIVEGDVPTKNVRFIEVRVPRVYVEDDALSDHEREFEEEEGERLPFLYRFYTFPKERKEGDHE